MLKSSNYYPFFSIYKYYTYISVMLKCMLSKRDPTYRNKIAFCHTV